MQVSVQVSGSATVQCLNDLPIQDGRYQLGDLSEAAVVDLLFSLDIAPGGSGPITLQVNVSWLEADSQEERGASAESSLACASDEDAAAAAPDADAVRHVVKIRGARIREQALVHNRQGDYQKAKGMVDEEMAELRAMAAAVPAAQADIDDLRDLENLGEEMTMMEQKRAHFSSYQARRSRPDIERK